MYICYIDESGDPGPHGSSHLLLGAAALFEGQWGYLRRELELMLAAYFPNGPSPNEIHLAELRSGKKEYRTLTQIQRDSLLDDYCGIVGQLLTNELRLFTVVADKAWWFAKNPGKSGDDLYAQLFEDLSSRFDLFLRRRHAELAPSKGMIVADPHKQALTKALARNHKLFQLHGTKWAKVHHVIETVFFLDSFESPGIQIADLCSYAVWRLVTANDPPIAQKIFHTFDREPPGSAINPGKWHGVKYYGANPAVIGRIKAVWPGWTQ